MLNIKYDIQSKDLNAILNIKVNQNKYLFFAALSKLSSLYNLTIQGHKLARVELFKVTSELERILSSYSAEIEKYSIILQENNIEPKTVRSIDINLGNAVGFKLFEAMKNIDTIYKRNHFAFIKTGRNPKTNIIHKYSKELKALLTKIYSLNVKSLLNKELKKDEKALYEASKDYSVMPEISEQKTA